jgi:Cu+-exporting ATPase
MMMPSEYKTFPSKGKYTCLMHSNVVSDTPGHCHKCGMKLVPMSQQNVNRDGHKMQCE